MPALPLPHKSAPRFSSSPLSLPHHHHPSSSHHPPSRPATAATAATDTVKQPLPSTSGDGGDWSSPGLASRPRDPGAPEFFKTPSGAAVQEVTPGDPAARPAADGDTVDVDFVLRRANGYFIYANVEGVSFQPADVPTAPFLFRLGDPAVLPGFADAVRGMRPGGKRRALVPPGAGYKAFPGGLPQAPTFATK